MKSKKALKRLKKVEAILSNVIDQLAASANGVREKLGSAVASVVSAKESMLAPPKAAKKPPVKATKARRRLSAEGRKKLSIAAKKRWAIAKRKGVSAVTGRALSQTA